MCAEAAARALLFVISAACAGCGADSADLSPLRLKHGPPIGQLQAEQLRSLSMECENYPTHGSMRGRYESAYCVEAMAAWADAPLQMVPMQKSPQDGPL